MIKRVLAVGMVQLVLCLALATGAETQSNKAVEFIKLSSEAENYFLNEDYERVKTAVEKTVCWMKYRRYDGTSG